MEAGKGFEGHQTSSTSQTEPKSRVFFLILHLPKIDLQKPSWSPLHLHLLNSAVPYLPVAFPSHASPDPISAAPRGGPMFGAVHRRGCASPNRT